MTRSNQFVCLLRTTEKRLNVMSRVSDPVAGGLRSAAYVCGCSIDGISGSNPAESTNIVYLCFLCVV